MLMRFSSKFFRMFLIMYLGLIILRQKNVHSINASDFSENKKSDSPFFGEYM